MKRIFLFLLSLLVITSAFAKTDKERSHWTILVGADKHFYQNSDPNRKYSDTHYETQYGSSISAIWTQHFVDSNWFINYQLATGLWSHALYYEADIETGHYKSLENRFWNTEFRPSVSIGYQWEISNNLKLDAYAGVEKIFCIEQNCPASNQEFKFDTFPIKGGINLHFNKHWMTSVEFATSLTRIDFLNSSVQRLQIGMGYKF